MDDEALAEALRVLRAADDLRTALPLGSRDREMIEAHLLILDREIHSRLLAPLESAQADAALRAAARATAIRVGEIEPRSRP